MTKPSDKEDTRELARKVVAYLESVCPKPPGALRWQDYLTGDDEEDAPVLHAVARALGLTAKQLLAKAEEKHRADSDVGGKRTFVPCDSNGEVVCMAEARRKAAKRVAARFMREQSVTTQSATCAGMVSDAE